MGLTTDAIGSLESPSAPGSPSSAAVLVAHDAASTGGPINSFDTALTGEIGTPDFRVTDMVLLGRRLKR